MKAIFTIDSRGHIKQHGNSGAPDGYKYGYVYPLTLTSQ